MRVDESAVTPGQAAYASPAELEERIEKRRQNPDLVPSMFLWKDFGEEEDEEEEEEEEEVEGIIQTWGSSVRLEGKETDY